jgi:hypothetical protein
VINDGALSKKKRNYVVGYEKNGSVKYLRHFSHPPS